MSREKTRASSPRPQPEKQRKKKGTKKRKAPLPDHRAEDFFVLRSPLLPFDDYRRWTEGAADRETLHRRLLQLARQPAIAEALFVASPSLAERLQHYNEAWPAKKRHRLQESLVRYLLRLMTRSTPFGLFAGSALGTVDGQTALALGARADYRRHTRLDMDFLYRLARDIERDHAIRPALTYFPNSSLYRGAGKLRYAEGRLSERTRTYHLVAVQDDLFLTAALEAAANGADQRTIARAIMATDPSGEIDEEEATAFVHELIDAQILVSDLGPRVSGPEPIHDLIVRLAALDKTAPVAANLTTVREALDSLDAQPLGSPVATYHQFARGLEPLGTEVQLPRLFQVDMVKPVDGLRLGRAVVAEVEKTVAFLHRLRGTVVADTFSTFREAFLRRYEPGRAVPLTAVLDEEIGIGFQRSAAIGNDNAPLLRGLPFPARNGDWEVPWSPALNAIVRKTFATAEAGQAEMVWRERDLKELGDEALKPLPDAFQAMFSILAPSAAAVDGGDFRLLFRGASGPSGAVLLGRFCHGDEALAARVVAHLQREEAHHPDAVFAEVVHLPEGRIGNILLRPVLRGYEIPFLGHSGADPARQIPISDLLVTVAGDQVILWSERLGKRVIPRLTSAHNFALRGLGIYRFLCALQHQGTAQGLSWSWGPLEFLPSLPRVVYGRSILSPATWRVEGKDLARWGRSEGEKRMGEIASWRQRRSIPEQVLLADGDNELFVDFANPLAVDAFVSIVKNRPQAVLHEHLQGASAAVQGPEGAYAHEIILPFVRRAPRAAARRATMPQIVRQPIDAHLPGSDWIYALLYTGTATADSLLVGPVHELVRRYGRELKAWFFLRYANPDFHLRVRFRLSDPGLRHDLLQCLASLAAPLLDQGQIWDLRLETYRPEVERYGGGEGLRLSEAIFHADSEAVLAMLPALRGDAGAEIRWLAALASVDGLLGALFADDGEAQAACLASMKKSFAEEFRIDAAMRKSLGGRLREKQKAIEAVLEGRAEAQTPLGHVHSVLAARDARLRAPMAQLRTLAADGRLTVPLPSLGGSLAHMAVNRLIHADARAHEVVLYDFLHRSMMSRRARRRAAQQVGAAS